MSVTGIICEYNPLHGGHVYQLQRAREAGGEVIVCLMSGNFVQRGEAAVLPPIPRAGMALAAGADLVLELPFPFAAGSARYFATAGVRALAGLGCDTLCFGSESADRKALLEGAHRLLEVDSREGAAPDMGDAAAHFAALGKAPAANDILALEYTRAILAEGLPMEIRPILREGARYSDATLGVGHPSATALRAALAREEDVTPFLPPVIGDMLQKALREQGGMADTARLGTALLARLRTRDLPMDIADCAGGLLAHLATAAEEATDYAQLCAAAATKRYTNGRIRRALLYLLAGVRREDLQAPPAYLRLLAANARGREYLGETRKTRTVAVTTKQADIAALGESAVRQRTLAAIADALYAICLPMPTRPAMLTGTPPVML